MIRIYVEAIPAYHEADDMTFKYVVYEEETLVKVETTYHDYRKPALVGLYSIMLLIKSFPEYQNIEVEAIVNDGALIEQIKGTTTTKKKDIIKVAELTRAQLSKYGNKLKVLSVAGTHEKVVDWERKLNV